jgi:hypothetical protein
VQRDPIGIRGGLNTYGYCEANSVDAADPLGAMSQVPWDDDLWLLKRLNRLIPAAVRAALRAKALGDIKTYRYYASTAGSYSTLRNKILLRLPPGLTGLGGLGGALAIGFCFELYVDFLKASAPYVDEFFDNMRNGIAIFRLRGGSTSGEPLTRGELRDLLGL